MTNNSNNHETIHSNRSSALTPDMQMTSPTNTCAVHSRPPAYNDDDDDFVILAIGSLDAWLHAIARLQSTIRNLSTDIRDLDLAYKSSGCAHVLWSNTAQSADSIHQCLTSVRLKLANLDSVKYSSLSLNDRRLASIHEQMFLRQVKDTVNKFFKVETNHCKHVRRIFLADLVKPDANVSFTSGSSTVIPRTLLDQQKKQTRDRYSDLVKYEARLTDLNAMHDDYTRLLEEQKTNIRHSIAPVPDVERVAQMELVEEPPHSVSEANQVYNERNQRRWVFLLLIIIISGAVCTVVIGVAVSSRRS